MLASDEEEERRFAVKIIRDRIRKGAELGSSQPRQFRAPPVNFQAENLQQLIDWDKVKLTEPLLTANLTSDQLVACLDSPLVVPSTWQCHSQSMERLRVLHHGGGGEEEGGVDPLRRGVQENAEEA